MWFSSTTRNRDLQVNYVRRWLHPPSAGEWLISSSLCVRIPQGKAPSYPAFTSAHPLTVLIYKTVVCGGSEAPRNERSGLQGEHAAWVGWCKTIRMVGANSGVDTIERGAGDNTTRTIVASDEGIAIFVFELTMHVLFGLLKRNVHESIWCAAHARTAPRKGS